MTYLFNYLQNQKFHHYYLKVHFAIIIPFSFSCSSFLFQNLKLLINDVKFIAIIKGLNNLLVILGFIHLLSNLELFTAMFHGKVVEIFKAFEVNFYSLNHHRFLKNYYSNSLAIIDIQLVQVKENCFN